MLSVSISLCLKIFPLYINILLGFLASKKLGVIKEAIAPLIVYIIAPMVVFYSTYQLKLSISIVLLPCMLLSISIIICTVTYITSRRFWNDNTRNILAFSAGTGNVGYFGLPIAFIFLSPDAANIYIVALLVSFVYEYTIGFYIISRGSYTFKQSVVKIFKLPVLYAFLLGLTFNLLEVKFSQSFSIFLESFKGTYTVLGMMMVGMGLSSLKLKEIDKKFIATTLCAKFLLWPAVVLIIIWLDSSFFKVFYTEVYQVLIVVSIVPMAANTVTMATLFKAKPEQAAITVLLSTVLAFFIIPIFLALFL